MLASEPVSAAIPPGTESQSRMAMSGQLQQASDALPAPNSKVPPTPQDSLPEILQPLPAPPDPPGTAYVAAVLSGALSPKPTSAREVLLRVGEWTPPDSPFHLTDKTI